MKRFLFITCAFLINIAYVGAQQVEEKVDFSKLKHPLKPFLWKVEGNGLKKPSYLLGSVHLGDPRLLKLHPAAERAFLQADTLATEVTFENNPQEAEQKDEPNITRKSQFNLKADLGLDLYKDVSKELNTISPDLDISFYETKQTWFLVLTLPCMESLLSHHTFMDEHLAKRATKLSKPNWALEPDGDSMDGYKELSVLEVRQALREYLAMQNAARSRGKTLDQEITEAYLLGTKKAMDEFNKRMEPHQVTSKELTEKLDREMDRRDQVMVKSINKKFRSHPDQSHFIIAGCAHFLERERNILKLLREQGYTVSRILK
ncbi:Uncharacterized conserved protein YbaP, TraB family [Rubritalea squalenifaciens DSM 18772]|uniref:Uncharacterized conserved protein YbaP, TraB family n=1 Tax=Rubritalea squalenifaciens DSM 18772 TaxID=1123071 RepID=A0A1M6EE08_9BACT|nr:TraB/GumN family protein [Rubritalea squalenifaciens]SHI83715.1 Uncharacterized conserved protein YbaP, TraB family [Rubritalea squalenifaciens DSM 18772]